MSSKIIDLIKKNPGKVVGIVLLIVVVIVLSVIFTSNKKDKHVITGKTEKEIIKDKLKNIVNIFNLSTTETFGENVVFNNGNNIINNLKLYFDYAFPGLDYDELNKKLKEYNVNLTAFEIFEKNKNIDIYNDIDIIDKYIQIGNPIMYTLYHIPRLNFSDMEDTINKLKLSYIISKITIKIFIKEVFNLKFIINKDYLINDTINIYYRTNNNESININDAINDSKSLSCLDENKLCKSSENIKDFAMEIKSLIKEEENPLYTKLFYLLITTYLMELENISTDKINEDNMKLYNTIFQPVPTPSLTTSLLTSTSAIRTLSSLASSTSLGSLLELPA
jgi:hypothetical protein